MKEIPSSKPIRSGHSVSGTWTLFVIWNFGFLVLSTSLPASAQEKPYDYVIKNALIFDGESLRPVKRDLAIAGDQIAQIGDVAEEEGQNVIQAEGLILAPGFIDIHTHSDFNPFVYVNLGNKVHQGVTTEVVGNCGMSAAPIEGRHEDQIVGVWRREGVEIPEKLAWKSFKEYVSESEFQGLETNFVALIGHGNLRSAVMGMEPRAASPDELGAMKTSLRQALEEGAAGISFGLPYLPGTFAAHEELVTLCKEAVERGGLCAFHIRSEGKKLIESIQEAVEIGREAGAPIHISHLKSAGVKNWPKITEAFRLIEEAQASGLRVTADAYPYTASFAELGVTLPDKIYEDPNRTPLLREPNKRKETLQELEKYYTENPVSWDRIKIATVTDPAHFPLQGKSILEIAEASKKSPGEALVDLLAAEDFKVSAFYFSQSKEVVDQILSKPYVAVGSDSIADGSRAPHPRAYGTFPHLLAQCRKEEVLAQNACWGRVIHHMSGLPAKILGLKRRGRIGAGLSADLVLFDPLTVQDHADYNHPKTPPEGIQWVFVNGEPVVREGRYEPIHSGLFLAREK